MHSLIRKVSRLQLSMKAKMILGFAIILVIVAGVSTFHLNQVDLIKQQIAHQNAELDKQKLALELKLTVNGLDAMKSNYMVSKKPEIIEQFHTEQEKFYEQVEAIAGTASNADQRKWSAKLTTTSKEYTATFDASVEIAGNNSLNALDMMKELERAHDLSLVHKEYIFELVDNFNTAYTEDASAAINASDEMLTDTAKVAMIALLCVVAVTSATAVILIRSFVSPVKRLQQAVRSIAAGDLRHKINSSSKDELGTLSQSFDHMIEQVRGMLANTQAVASYLADHAHTFHSFSSSTAAANADIVRAIQEISHGADQQASQTEQSSSIIASLEQEIEAISEFSRTVQTRSRETAFNTHTGSASMEALKQAAGVSDTLFQKVYLAMKSLSSSSSQITSIVNTISDISHQTNILALNAAIEAARAGVHGRGFSVIAEEVRQLSAQTGASSKQISAIIGSLSAQMKELDSHLSDARLSSEQQNGRMSECLDAFGSIRGSMDELAGQIDRIQEQIAQAKAKNGMLVESVQMVAAVAQETAAGVEEVNAASSQQDTAIHQIASHADDILVLSQKLFEEINKFQIGDMEATDASGMYAEADTAANDSEPVQPQEPAEDFSEAAANDSVEAAGAATPEPGDAADTSGLAPNGENSANKAEDENKEKENDKKLVTIG
jgi:methyl-accepting chemotaxis protein